MNAHTLICSLGTGMYRNNGYECTTYRFPNKQEHKTALFLEAVLKTAYWSVKKVILIGTRTTSWDALIPNREADKHIEFWEKVLNECSDKNTGISDESVRALESKLPSWYNNIPFKIMVHTDQISFDQVEEVFSVYMHIPDELEPETDILFDITHGFRSMPLLIFQSLQLNALKINGRNVKLIYGEYIKEEKISYVRDLSKYWDYYESGAAIHLFDEKLDGKLLAEKIKSHWESGSKCLVRFTEIVECNFSLQVPDMLRQINNALKDYNKEGKPQWVTDVWNTLNEMHKSLSPKADEKYPVAKTVWEYSKLLRKKDLITQGVIASQVAVETAITEKLDPSKIGDYVWFNGYPKGIRGLGNDYLTNIRKQDNDMSISLGQLERLRNQIAHGGGKDKKGNYPHQANNSGILKAIDRAIPRLFELLDEA